MKKKTLTIASPLLITKGGAEKVVLKTAKEFSKDYKIKILTGSFEPEKTYPEFQDFEVVEGFIKNINFFIRQLKLIFFFSIYKDDDSMFISNDFPTNLLSFRNKNLLFYCHAPPRILYDLKKEYLGLAPFFLRPFARLYLSILSSLDKKAVDNCRNILVNSSNVKKRVKRFYNRESKVVHPGTEIPASINPQFEKRLLSISRMFPEKRVELIVEAMKYLKDYNLDVVGDKGSSLKKIKEIITKNKLKNVKLHGAVESKTLKSLLKKCFATVYVPKDEDFGLIPIESNAYGKMCIGANEGGLKETIIDGKTGILVDDVSPEKISESVRKIEKINPKKKVEECRKNAKRFGWDVFFSAIRKEIKNLGGY